ncbi:MAG TPA: ferredoxin-thioredoxin reductase catalytic domain-containing protein [archaeon]|nr:ferredoxin-thioredoxin reductase catalytic domain-containing protein [archaeon]
MDQEEKRILKEAEEYAREKGLKLNPDKKTLEAVIKALAKTEQKYGKKYCPCRAVTGNAENDKKIICPCAFHLKEISDSGHCKCNLFFSD